MNKLIIASAASLLAGIAGAALYFGQADPAPEADVSIPGETGFDTSASHEKRLLALEQALADEREARQLLEDELFLLVNEMQDMRASGQPQDAAADAQQEDQQRREIVRRTRGSRDPVERAEFLEEQGFAADRAEYIARRESELRFEVMQSQWEARRNGETTNLRNGMVSADLALREELGNAEYEQYLVANGRSTAVAVTGVMQSSPAEGAGLKNGDRIVGYNGERVYSMLDMTRLVGGYDGSNPVVIDIERDGVPMQVTLPPGPLGITGNGAWRRR